MALESKLFTALSGSTLITSVTTGIYPMRAPQYPVYPHIIYTRISGNQINGLNGYMTAERPSIQIDIYSTGYAQAKSLSTSIHAVLDATTTFRAILISDTDLFEDEIDRYRRMLEFSCINLE